MPGIDRQQSRQRAQQRRLAGAVGAEQGNHLAGRDLDIDAMQHADLAVAGFQRACTESRGSAAEVSTDHLLVNANLGRGAGGQRAPEIEHGDLIADVEDQVGMVLDQQHAGAARR